MKKYNIPTARYRTFSSYSSAKHFIENECDYSKLVLKASGLALGKGVLLPESKQEALDGLKDIMVNKVFGDAGLEIVIEEFLDGQELSVLAFSDGYTIKTLPFAQDHKRVSDGDLGLNTGGMGTYSPSPLQNSKLESEIMDKVLLPTLKGMRNEGNPFIGLLFTGFMISKEGKVNVLEYNVRFGDPETQTLLSLLESDLAEVLEACIERRLDCLELKIRKETAAVTVVLASQGYPESYPKGIPISISTVPEGESYSNL